jgi:hypothetical protein
MSINFSFTITIFDKSGGPLTKRIWLTEDGTLNKNSSACIMARGRARRASFSTLGAFANCIGALSTNQAIALGNLRPDLPDDVEIISEDKLKLMNGVSHDVIARVGDNIIYQPDRPAVALWDYDSKGMSPEAAARIAEAGGPWSALTSVLPALANTARVVRSSTSAGLFRDDTGEKLPGSDGQHAYLLVQDGEDIVRFLKALHARCWLAGFGWMLVGRAGQLLERSIVDCTVGTPERLVFEGAPVLVPPLQQDGASPQPLVIEGEILGTMRACPPLTVVEQSQLNQMLAKARAALQPEVKTKRAIFVADKRERLMARGLTAEEADQVTRQQCEGLLLPSVELPFDRDELAGHTVADVLADPAAFEGKTLADPLEGIEYGNCKAKILLRYGDGEPFIHSCAHGVSTCYELKYDAATVRAALDRTTDNVLARAVELILRAELNADELEQIRHYVRTRTGAQLRTIDHELKAAREAKKARKAKEEHDRHLAERRDPRPELSVPWSDAPYQPVMDILDEVLSRPAPEPPTRDMEGYLTAVRKRRVPNMHALDNEGRVEDDRLPPPEQWLLTRLDEMQVAELIEQHIDFVTARGRSVHLPPAFVQHYLRRTGDALPLVAAVGIAPMVLPDGRCLAQEKGLDRYRGIIWRVPKEIIALIPQREECTPTACAEALRFLIEEWLCDVQTSFVGKCTAVSAALTIIERTQLDNRPTYSVDAGKAGGGKTTLLQMLIYAVTGLKAAGAAWSDNVEERRKTLLSYLSEGVAYIIWDNIKKGAQISCPHIERSCTIELYSDRRLGVSEILTAAASAIHFFTGNNIALLGDLKTRDLNIRLQIERSDPEDRDFQHPYPLDWTADNRAAILRAMYTILLGNPELTKPLNAPSKTRFKTWWRLVGSAVEHAAKCAVEAELIKLQEGETGKVDFQKLFLEQRQEEEETLSIVDALLAMEKQWPVSFTAADVAGKIGDFKDEDGQELREFLYPNVPPHYTINAKGVTRKLRPYIDDVRSTSTDEYELALRKKQYDRSKNTIVYRIERKPKPKDQRGNGE